MFKVGDTVEWVGPNTGTKYVCIVTDVLRDKVRVRRQMKIGHIYNHTYINILCESVRLIK